MGARSSVAAASVVSVPIDCDPETAMNLPRSSGVLLHPTSLPGGRLGSEARAFVDWLVAARPVVVAGPAARAAGRVRLAVQAASAFAGWRGLLDEPGGAGRRRRAGRVRRPPLRTWIGEWAAFAGEHAVADQVRFEREWRALRAYANERGVGLIGDLPIYVADERRRPPGAPRALRRRRRRRRPARRVHRRGPALGQPDLRLVRHARDRLPLVDRALPPHVRAPSTSPASTTSAASSPTGPCRPSPTTAKNGTWRPGPGRDLFDAVAAELGALPLIAEDLGVITRAGRAAARRARPARVCTCSSSASTTTRTTRTGRRHTARTASSTRARTTTTRPRGWWDSLDDDARRRTGLDPADPAWGLVELAYASPARLAIVPVQDLLGLGGESRMNVPGREQGNWRWRLEEGQLTDALAGRVREATRAAGR